MKIICDSDVVRIPVTRLRVVCGLGVTIATFSPSSWFNSVDFPTLGRPTMAMYPERNGVFAASFSGDLDIDFKSARLYYDTRETSFKIEIRYAVDFNLRCSYVHAADEKTAHAARPGNDWPVFDAFSGVAKQTHHGGVYPCAFGKRSAKLPKRQRAASDYSAQNT